jgi:hypothetical protein
MIGMEVDFDDGKDVCSDVSKVEEQLSVDMKLGLEVGTDSLLTKNCLKLTVQLFEFA